IPANYINDIQTSPANEINDSQTNPANYIKLFADTTPVEFVSDAVEQKDLVIATAYKQVFGNAHLMESERVLEAESQLRSDQITVMEFIRQLAKSERYRTLVFEKNSNLRAIELNFKHLLGRAPDNYAEISEHIARLVNEGFHGEIDSYIDSKEYFEFFGTNIVPYYRGYQTQTGRNLAGYTNSFQLAQGKSSSDKSMPPSSYRKLDKNLLNSGSNAITVLLDKINISEVIQKFSQSSPRPQPLVSKYGPRSVSPSANIYAPEEIIRRALKLDNSPKQSQIYKKDIKSYDVPAIPDSVTIIRKALKLTDTEKS
ncbi:MAG: phycobilisome rod-core linker polypeptide, partial [Pseudomonadota bacterium]